MIHPHRKVCLRIRDFTERLTLEHIDDQSVLFVRTDTYAHAYLQSRSEGKTFYPQMYQIAWLTQIDVIPITLAKLFNRVRWHHITHYLYA